MSSSHEEKRESAGREKPRKSLDRRQFLKRSSAAAAASALLPKMLPAFRLGAPNPNRDVFLQIYLRGGADGLSFVVPQFREADLIMHRPDINIPKSGSGGATPESHPLAGSGGYELNDAAFPLLDAYNSGDCAFLHASGNLEDTLSHFDAMKFMEFGWPVGGSTTLFSGWLARHLEIVADCDPSVPLRALSMTQAVIQTLAQAPEVFATPRPNGPGFFGAVTTAPGRKQALVDMFNAESDPVRSATLTAFDVIDRLANVDWDGYDTGGVTYPMGSLGEQLKSAATMIHDPNIPVEAMTIDVGGWDDHNNLGPLDAGGAFYDRLQRVATAIRAFYDDLVGKGTLGNVVMLVVSEFGRRIYENGSDGTDHGRGGCAMVLGGGVGAGTVLPAPANFPDLGVGAENVDVVIDIQEVMWEMLLKRMGANAADRTIIFPGLTTWTDHGIFV